MNAPLADRIRPKTLDDVVGQQHILGPNKVLRRIIESGTIPNMVFYGPSGVGKTTVASIIAKQSHMHLCKLNGTTDSTAEIRDVVAQVNTLQARISLPLAAAMYVKQGTRQSFARLPYEARTSRASPWNLRSSLHSAVPCGMTETATRITIFFRRFKNPCAAPTPTRRCIISHGFWKRATSPLHAAA